MRVRQQPFLLSSDPALLSHCAILSTKALAGCSSVNMMAQRSLLSAQNCQYYAPKRHLGPLAIEEATTRECVCSWYVHVCCPSCPSPAWTNTWEINTEVVGCTRMKEYMTGWFLPPEWGLMSVNPLQGRDPKSTSFPPYIILFILRCWWKPTSGLDMTKTKCMKTDRIQTGKNK